MNDLERKFHAEMVEIFKVAKKEIGYNANRFIQMVSEKGGVKTAKILISKEGGTDGFEVLLENRRLDLSVEAHVLKPEYEPLFTDEERLLCKERLEKMGYVIE